MHQEDQGRRGKRDHYCTSLVNADLVHRINENISNQPIIDSKKKESNVKPTHKQDSAIMAKNHFNCMPNVWKSNRNSGFSKTSASFIMASWRTGTKNNIKHSLKDDFSTALNGKLIQFHHL